MQARPAGVCPRSQVIPLQEPYRPSLGSITAQPQLQMPSPASSLELTALGWQVPILQEQQEQQSGTALPTLTPNIQGHHIVPASTGQHTCMQGAQA